MILFKTSLHLFYAESASAIDWDLSTGEEGGVQMKWRKNINCNEVRKLSSTLINEWETFDCRYYLFIYLFIYLLFILHTSHAAYKAMAVKNRK